MNKHHYNDAEEEYDPGKFQNMISSINPDDRAHASEEEEAQIEIPKARRRAKAPEPEEEDEEVDESYKEDIFNEDEELEDAEEEEEESYKKKKKPKSSLKQKRKREDKRSSRKLKKKANKRDDLIDIEASDDFDEEEEVDDGEAEISKKEQAKLLKQYEMRDITQNKRKMREFYSRPADEIAEGYEKMDQYQDAEDEELNRDELAQQSNQPSVKDPKLWLVKCRLGKEKEAVQSVYHKYFSLIDTEKALKIASAIYFDSLKGNIYIEAFKEAHVREAIDGIASLRETGMKIVPIDEMTAVFNYDKVEKYDIKVGQWVRLKSGVYDGDLAKVIFIEDPINKIVVKVIPRLGDIKDYNKTVKKVVKLPQKLFNPTGLNVESEHTKYGIKVQVYNRNSFSKDGFLIKVVKAKSLLLDGVEPKLEELKIFNTFSMEGEGEQPRYEIGGISLDGVNSRKNKFIKGDKVKVIKGDLTNVIGIVEGNNNGYVQIIPSNIDYFNEVLDIPEDMVVKNFLPGDNIKVIAGNQAGKGGLIVKVEDDNAFVFSDITMTEFKVSFRDIVLSSHLTHVNEKNNLFEIDNLVKINGTNQICQVLDVDRYSLKVIDTMSQVKSVGIKEVTKFVQNLRRVNGIDSRGNPITLNDTVKILNGHYKGKKGVIKNLFKNIVFLYNHDFPSTNGIFVERTENVEIMGAELLKESNENANSYTLKVNVKTVPEKFKEMIGNAVKITGGNWKGYLGTLKSVNDKTARVELTSKAKIVSVDKNFVAKPGDFSRNDSSINTPRNSGSFKTPAYYPQSPFNPTSPKWNAGGQTPGNIWQSPKSPNNRDFN